MISNSSVPPSTREVVREAEFFNSHSIGSTAYDGKNPGLKDGVLGK